jgi:acetoin utilization deacetylase AcuC-like enzyme
MQPLRLAMDHEPKFLRHLRRRANQVFARWLPQPARFVYGPQYQFAWPGMPIDEVRGERVLTALAAEGLLRREHIRQPPLASYHAILRVHADAYIESAQTAATMSQIVGMPVSDRDTQRILDLQRSMTGGTMLATDIALSTGDLAINLGGGFHHARPSSAAALVSQRRRGGDRRAARARLSRQVLVIDLDMHDGDGTRAIFAATTSVHTLSIHNRDWGHRPARRVDPRRARRRRRRRQLPRRRAHPRQRRPAAFRPKLVYFLAGVDGAADDPLGDWSLSDDTLQPATRRSSSCCATSPRTPPSSSPSPAATAPTPGVTTRAASRGCRAGTTAFARPPPTS